MNELELRLPHGAEPYLALQRTEYQHPVNRVFRKLKLGRLYDRALMPRVEAGRAGHMALRYRDALKEEFAELLPALPNKVAASLDIGCGMSGIDLMLFRHYQGALDLHLLDREGISDVFYGFEKEAAYYNSLALAQQFLTINGVEARRIHPRNVDAEGFPPAARFDLVISLLSWCYHYPAETYASQVAAALSDGGTLIVDVREGTDGHLVLERALGVSPSVLRATEKYNRFVFSRA